MPDENFLTLLKAMLHVSNKTAVYTHRQWEHLSFVINLLLLQQFYIAPLQANLLRSISSPTSDKQCGLKARVKYSRCVRRSATGRPFPTNRNRNRNRKLQTSKAPLKSQAQGTSLFTSAASNQRGFPKNSPWEAQV